MSKRTLALIAGLIVVTVILIVVAINPKKTNIPLIPGAATPTPVEQSSLMLTPNPLILESSATGTQSALNISINTGVNNVTAVQLELKFDPKVITNLTFEPGNLFTNPFILTKNIDVANGRATYALGIPPGGKPINGVGTVAKINFTATGAAGTSTQIEFLPKTMVTSEGVSPSVLKSTTGAEIQFRQNSENPLPQ